MKVNLSIDTIAAALAALKIRAIEADAANFPTNKFKAAYTELQAATYAVLTEQLAEAPDDLLKLNSIHH